MQRIEIPAAVRRKPTPVKLAVGVAFLAFSAAIMVPWAAMIALWTLGAMILRGCAAAYDAALYAGEELVGR